MRACIALLCALFVIAPGAASAANPPTPGSWASQLTELADLVKPDASECTAHCWVLEALRLSGSVDRGSLAFELTGQVLQKGGYDVPLFGPADKLRLENVTENGARATLGFEEGHWYVHTSAPRFVVRGTIFLPASRSISVVGPVNTLDADVRDGRVSEGAHLTALSNAGLHFDAASAEPPPQPAIFSIARALRAGKDVAFEYKIDAQSASDLGVVRLPLRYGERVVDVTGAPGWRVENDELLLPAAGTRAQATVTGTIANVAAFSPDPRSAFEWWLLETDPEHRVLATGDAKQHDVGESPIVRREPTSRLFLVERGQRLNVAIEKLESVDVLAATVRSHSRDVVWTSTGDLVEQDRLDYENSGIDYLRLSPAGKPLYLAIDSASQRVMHADGSSELMVPMRLGRHDMTVQSIGHETTAALFGRVTLSGPRVPFASSDEQLAIGLPAAVHPLLLTGGDATRSPGSSRDLLALALSLLGSTLALRKWKLRALGVFSLFGLWFVNEPAFVAAFVLAVAFALSPLVARSGKLRRVAIVGGGLTLAVAAGVWLVATRTPLADSKLATLTRAKTEDNEPHIARQAAVNEAAEFGMIGMLEGGGGRGEGIGVSANSLVDGVRPVPLSMPGYVRSISTSRELVTPARPFTPTLYYVTDAGLAFLTLSWIVCVAALAFSQRERLWSLRERLRGAFEPELAPAPQALTR